MNAENSKSNEAHIFKSDLIDEITLKEPNKNVDLANLSIYYTWKNIKSEYNNNKFKILAPTWNDTFDLPDGSYSISDIQDYFLIHYNKTWNFDLKCTSWKFGQLINISSHSLTMMIKFNTEFCFVEVWFTHQASSALEIEDNVNLTLIIG